MADALRIRTLGLEEPGVVTFILPEECGSYQCYDPDIPEPFGNPFQATPRWATRKVP